MLPGKKESAYRPCSGLSLLDYWVGLAEGGQRRAEGPSGLDQVGLDSYVDPGSLIIQWEICKSYREVPHLVMWRTKSGVREAIKRPLQDDTDRERLPRRDKSRPAGSAAGQ